MSNPMDPSTLIGRHAVDSDGDKLGTIEQVYINDTSGEPEWVTVKTGLFGTKESFAPLQGATDNGDALQLAVTKEVVKGAPNVDNDGHTNDDEQRALWDYYAGQLGWSGSSDGGAEHEYVDEDRTDVSGAQGYDTQRHDTQGHACSREVVSSSFKAVLML